MIGCETATSMTKPVTDSMVDVPVEEITADEDEEEFDWLADIRSKTGDRYQDLNCDNNDYFGDSMGQRPDSHYHNVDYYHTHKYWTSSHKHEEGKLIESRHSLLEEEANNNHSHRVYIRHAHEHDPFIPPTPFHTHSCE